jgi:rhodanese-related sulfurtransferase
VKKIFVLIALVVAVILAASLLSANDCKSDKCNVTPTPVPTPTVQVTIIQQLADTRGTLIDVRTTEEFTESHATSAINLPLADIQNGIYPDIAKDTAIYLYCRTGNRAGQAKTILEQAGFTKVTNIGGLIDWQTQGGEVISE